MCTLFGNGAVFHEKDVIDPLYGAEAVTHNDGRFVAGELMERLYDDSLRIGIEGAGRLIEQ